MRIRPKDIIPQQCLHLSKVSAKVYWVSKKKVENST